MGDDNNSGASWIWIIVVIIIIIIIILIIWWAVSGTSTVDPPADPPANPTGAVLSPDGPTLADGSYLEEGKDKLYDASGRYYVQPGPNGNMTFYDTKSGNNMSVCPPEANCSKSYAGPCILYNQDGYLTMYNNNINDQNVVWYAKSGYKKPRSATLRLNNNSSGLEGLELVYVDDKSKNPIWYLPAMPGSGPEGGDSDGNGDPEYDGGYDGKYDEGYDGKYDGGDGDGRYDGKRHGRHGRHGKHGKY